MSCACLGRSRRAALAALVAASALRAGAAEPPPGPPALLLRAILKPSALPADKEADVSIVLTFTNGGRGPIDIFPGAARWSELVSWAGPFIAVEARPGQSDRAFESPEVDSSRRTYRELRSEGPPGSPPAPSFFQSNRVHLLPGQSTQTTRRACFVPRGWLAPEHLSRQTLDPDQANGYGGFAAASVLAFDRTCGELDHERRARPDFLRPGVAVFFPAPGAWQLRFAYWQHRSVGLSVRTAPIRVTARPLLVDVP